MANQHPSGKSNANKSSEEKGLEEEFDGQASPPHPEKKGAHGNAKQKTEPDDEKHDDQDFFELKS